MKLQVFCKNIGQYVEIEGGTTLLQIADMLADRLPEKPICCRVNNKTEPLDFAVYSPKQVEFQDMTVGSGPRVYVRSLCMMLFRAVCAVLPGAKLVIEHSIARGYYCRIDGMCGVGDG